jgi:hypothetical protein
MNEGKRYRNLRHIVALNIYDGIQEGQKVDYVEQQIEFFFKEAVGILFLEAAKGKNGG